MSCLLSRIVVVLSDCRPSSEIGSEPDGQGGHGGKKTCGVLHNEKNQQMRYHPPNQVTSPQDYVSNVRVLFDGGDDSVSIAKI